MEALSEMVRIQARRDLATTRERVMRNVEQIGYPRTERIGNYGQSTRDYWIQGTRYTDIDRRVAEIE